MLTTVSGVLLLFCSSALQRASLPLLAGLVLALAGLAAACASSLWAWGYTRLSLRLGRGEAPSSADAARRATGRARLGLAVNLAGLTASLLGAEAIVGTLAAKSFTQGALTVATSRRVPTSARRCDRAAGRPRGTTASTRRSKASL